MMFFFNISSRIDIKFRVALQTHMPSQITLLPAVMKLKTQIKTYQKLMNELSRKYDGAEDFINTRIKQLCLEHGRLEGEVCLYVFLCCIYSLVTNSV